MAGARPQRSKYSLYTRTSLVRAIEKLERASADQRAGAAASIREANERATDTANRSLELVARARKAEDALERQKERVIHHIDALMRISNLKSDLKEIPCDVGDRVDLTLAFICQRITDIIGRVHEPVLSQAKEAVQS